MTYSIIGRDPETGEIGLAVQSRYFAAGRAVPYVEGGVGVIASQAFLNPAYGYKGLELLRGGATPHNALEQVKAGDEGQAMRQVAIMDWQGRIAVHTGDRCVPACGHEVGEHCVAQGNMLARDEVWQAMVPAFERTEGRLAERLVAALRAAEDAGGDARGSQGAGLVVVGLRTTDNPASDRRLDLRIDDHADPVGEIERLLRYVRAHNRATASGAKLATDPAGALADLDASLAAFPDDFEFRYRRGVALLALGRTEEARAAIAGAGGQDPMEWLLRMAEAGALPMSRDVLTEALGLS